MGENFDINKCGNKACCLGNVHSLTNTLLLTYYHHSFNVPSETHRNHMYILPRLKFLPKTNANYLIVFEVVLFFLVPQIQQYFNPA